MGSKGARRLHSHLTQAQAHENLRSTQVAHQQRLLRQAAAASSGPALPTAAAASSLAGLEGASPLARQSEGGSPTSGYPPWRSGSAGSTALAPTQRPPALPSPAGGSGNGPPTPRRTSSSGRASGRRRTSGTSAHSPRRAASSGGSARSSRNDSPTVSTEGGAIRTEEDTDDEDNFAAMLEELDDLSRHLGLRPAVAHAEVSSRPTTGSVAASASTACPPSGRNSGSGSGAGAPPSRGSGSADFDEWTPNATGDLGASLSASFGAADILESLRGAQRADYELQQRSALPLGCRIKASGASSSQFFFDVDVTEGPYMPTTLSFWIKVFDDFPAPDSYCIRCTRRFFHPCVQPDGGNLEVPQDALDACGGSTLRSLLSAIRRLLLTPSEHPPANPGNADAANLMRRDPDEFRRQVRLTLLGGEYKGVRYDCLLSAGPKGATAAKDQTLAAQAAANAAALVARGTTPDTIKMDVMKLEVEKDQFKKRLEAMQAENEQQISLIENSM
eukprot:TRINITY_DN54105_c0_g1_i1.p1 TRINITY_DN54105_c0_g1~~TRINITY_DN54105_c0_g1_i1.p1  ORF type:complete len:503 (-),score=100.02 TRINITY_DN54105_c0_g1_i1:80-1588(-)